METTTDYILNCPVPIGLAIGIITLILLKCAVIQGGDICGCFSCLLSELLVGGILLGFTTTKKPFLSSDTISCPTEPPPPPPISKSRAVDPPAGAVDRPTYVKLCTTEPPPPLISKSGDVDRPAGAVDRPTYVKLCTTELPLISKSGDVVRPAGAVDRRRDVKLTRREVEMVMGRLGLVNGGEEVVLEAEEKVLVGWEEIGCVFGEEEPSVGEVKEAFDVFDRNGDGYIDAAEMRRVLCALGVEQVSEGECRRRLMRFDGEKNVDGRIDFKQFIKIVDKSFI